MCAKSPSGESEVEEKFIDLVGSRKIHRFKLNKK